MGIKKTIGGDRLGSGKRMKQEMKNFYRSNHNLSKTWKSTMAPGVLYPAYCNLLLPGDTFDFNINAFMRTIPTQGPLFSSFKLQVDVFTAPIRLYQGILHNNATEIGLKMNQVLLPKMEIMNSFSVNEMKAAAEHINSSSLVKYLGFSGIGTSAFTEAESTIGRKLNAVPMLAYYDIFKNYYANKQEEMAYVITGKEVQAPAKIQGIYYDGFKEGTFSVKGNYYTINVIGENLSINNINIDIEDYTSDTLTYFIEEGLFELVNISANEISFKPTEDTFDYNITITTNGVGFAKEIVLQEFPLKNIDNMRYQLLTKFQLGQEYIIRNENAELPYKCVVGRDDNGKTFNKFVMNGLVVKTYQSDIFNNWIDTEWIDGENGINQISAVSTESGHFTIDALNLANKVYNMLNRIALSGGTYQDWIEAVWSKKVKGVIEKPIYHGGMSSEVVFEEVVSTAATTENKDYQALGSLGGRGKLDTRKDGNVVIKNEDEPCFIMIMASLTPRIDYTQGNKWYLTELDSLDDVHKPSLDQIGFQDLIVEKMAWWDTRIAPSGTTVIFRNSVGKQPAWLDYMTDVDEAFGEFADVNKANYMILSRNYEKGGFEVVKDITTYIDPQKFNYAFAYDGLDAQNFWGFIKFDIQARRMMSARQIPNL